MNLKTLRAQLFEFYFFLSENISVILTDIHADDLRYKLEIVSTLKVWYLIPVFYTNQHNVFTFFLV
jgi:hypothetical protein